MTTTAVYYYKANGKVDYISLTEYAKQLVDYITVDEEYKETFFIFENDLTEEKKKVRKRKK